MPATIAQLQSKAIRTGGSVVSKLSSKDSASRAVIGQLARLEEYARDAQKLNQTTTGYDPWEALLGAAQTLGVTLSKVAGGSYGSYPRPVVDSQLSDLSGALDDLEHL